MIDPSPNGQEWDEGNYWEALRIVQVKDDDALEHAFSSEHKRCGQIWGRFCSKN